MMGKADREFLVAHLRSGMTVVDIGANQGLYSLLFARQVGPDGHVLAFEPDDILIRRTRWTISRLITRTTCRLTTSRSGPIRAR